MEDSEDIFHLDETMNLHQMNHIRGKEDVRKNDRGKIIEKGNEKDNKKNQQSNNEFVFKQINELHKELPIPNLKLIIYYQN